MNPSLSAVLFCLVICAVFVWLAVKRMRADKPYRVFVWLARFFGVMVVMGVYEAFRREGIQLGGLIVWGAGIGAWILVPWIIRELSRRKNRDQDSEQRPPVEQKKEKYSTASKPIRLLQVAIILIGCGLYVFTSECLIEQYSSSIIHKHGGATFVLAWFVLFALIIPFIKNILNKGIRFYKEESPEKFLSCLLIVLLLLTLWFTVLNYMTCLFSYGFTFFELLKEYLIYL